LPSTLRAIRRPLAAVLLAAAVGCAPAMRGATAPGGPTDPEIASIALALNLGEVTTNRPATSKATQAEVRAFAERMVTDHTLAVERMRALGIPESEPPLTRQLEDGARETVSALELYQGPAFDRTHMDSQVALHEYALRTLDDYLIPYA